MWLNKSGERTPYRDWTSAMSCALRPVRTPMLALVLTAQVWNARRISVSQLEVLAWEFSKLKSPLGAPPAFVPSRTKLSVRCPGSGQGWPKLLGVRRSSSCSRRGARFARIGGTSVAVHFICNRRLAILNDRRLHGKGRGYGPGECL